VKLKTIYSRPRIDRLLGQCSDYPLTVVVAGAGYGKTTAAAEFLKKTAVPHMMITLTSGNADVFWDKLCSGMESCCKEAADHLRILGLPIGAWEVSRVVRLACEACKAPFIICIDDYQLLPEDSPVHTLVETLAFEKIDDLHILLLSRSQPNIRIGTLASKEMVLCVDADVLAFDVKETDGYLAMRGLRLTKSAVEGIHESSGGWVSAIYLLGEGLRAGGKNSRGRSIDSLFEENLINPLAEIDRDMLYRISYFESFPLDMAVTALGMERFRDVIAAMMRENAFITKNSKGEYRFHPLLRDYLYAHCPEDAEQKALYRRAVLWYAARKDRKYFYSVELVKKADCTEEYLALFNKPNASRLNYYDMASICRMANELPENTCLRYPFPFLQICFYLLLSGQNRYMTFAGTLLDRMNDFFAESSYEYRDIILAEIIVISRVTGFGQYGCGNEPLEEAAKLFCGRQSEILNPADPFTFGLPMLLHSEYMEAGTLDETVRRCMYNPYELVSDGFGRGSEPLIRAETALLRCDMKQALLLAGQSALEAKEKDQYFIMVSAYSTLMRRSLFLGNTEDASKQLGYIREVIASAARTLTDSRLTVIMLREVLTLAECFFNLALFRTGEIPSDFLDGTHRHMMADGLGVPQVYSAKAMYITGNPAGALSICERLDKMPNACQEARLCALILISLAREKLGAKGSGISALSTALSEAQADGIILPFAENPDILPMLEKIRRRGKIDAAFLENVRSRCEGYRDIAPQEPVDSAICLSARELEVLQLTAQGKSRAEVAAMFHVQENTVKAQLASVYKKLGARGKTEAVRLAKTFGLL